MAEVRHRVGRGAYDFVHKLCKRYLLEIKNKQGKIAIQASALSPGFLLGDIQNGELYGAENAADRVTVGVSQDSYTRVTQLFSTVDDVWENGNVAEYYYYYLGLNKEYSLPNKTLVQNIERNLPLYRSNARFRRTFCTCRSARRQQSLGSRRLCWGHGEFVFTRAYSGNGTRSEPLYKTKTGYYEVLQVTPTATQAQIKTAYYKQSFIYHPDRNASSGEATVRFSEISEAYTVLGNKALRKKYDRGLLSQSDLIATARPSVKGTTGSSKQTEGRRSVVGGDSRGGVFDFDKFFKDHYNEQLQRQRDIRVRKEEMLRKKQETIGEKKLGRMMEMGVGALLAMAVAILISLKRG
ncbi:dnaJ homolog subfamily C member 18-like [Siniperca chuatsi]|uniref:dnaJ homolog subfamily C member 18-like n=1 Tax=Siniperca chuatsi TaxID=119488 RepID=UPI001CE1B9A6|nr:dnaJ homolog subfamily C member 18-like [Siniperca chuatsi]